MRRSMFFLKKVPFYKAETASRLLLKAQTALPDVALLERLRLAETRAQDERSKRKALESKVSSSVSTHSAPTRSASGMQQSSKLRQLLLPTDENAIPEVANHSKPKASKEKTLKPQRSKIALHEAKVGNLNDRPKLTHASTLAAAVFESPSVSQEATLQDVIPARLKVQAALSRAGKKESFAPV